MKMKSVLGYGCEIRRPDMFVLLYGGSSHERIMDRLYLKRRRSFNFVLIRKRHHHS